MKSTSKYLQSSTRNSILEDASHIRLDNSSLFLKMGAISSASTSSNDKKSPNLVFHSSKKISLLLLPHQFTFSLLMMVILALLQLFSYTLPLVECFDRPTINRFFPYGIYNLHQDSAHRSSRLFPNLAVNLPPLRDSIPSSTYSKSIRRASKFI